MKPFARMKLSSVLSSVALAKGEALAKGDALRRGSSSHPSRERGEGMRKEKHDEECWGLRHEDL